MNRKCGSGGMADALASGASGGNPVEVQLLSTAPFDNSGSRAYLLSFFIFPIQSIKLFMNSSLGLFYEAL